jgi:hypothetical protein
MLLSLGILLYRAALPCPSSPTLKYSPTDPWDGYCRLLLLPSREYSPPRTVVYNTHTDNKYNTVEYIVLDIIISLERKLEKEFEIYNLNHMKRGAKADLFLVPRVAN